MTFFLRCFHSQAAQCDFQLALIMMTRQFWKIRSPVQQKIIHVPAAFTVLDCTCEASQGQWRYFFDVKGTISPGFCSCLLFYCANSINPTDYPEPDNLFMTLTLFMYKKATITTIARLKSVIEGTVNCMASFNEVNRPFRSSFCVCFKRVQMRNLSWKSVLLTRSFECKSNSFSYERFCTWTRFETEAEGD